MEARRITVTLTRNDIRAGLPGDPNRCPVALAVIRATGNAYVCVGPSHLLVRGYLLDTPPEVIAFIRAFDNADETARMFMPPISFELELPG